MTEELRAALEPLLPYRFVRPEHLVLAVTHRSLSPELPNNETLEFLGDAVLGLAMSDLLMRRFPDAREGDLSKRRAALVNAGVLARKARAIDLGRWLRLGKGEEKTGGRDKESILAAGYEAVLGAIYLDGGYEAARGVVEAQFGVEAADEMAAGQEDWKTRLQELCQRRWRETPVYVLVEESGPDHAKRFVSELAVRGELRGRGVGHSKKAAEQAAAREALTALAALGET
ncbi:MAG: ribonuclease III [bacterium]|nr:ribonuclease III [bacterium]